MVETHAAATDAAAPTTTTAPPARACAERLAPDVSAAQMLMALVDEPGAATPAVAAGQVGGYALRGNQQGDVAAQTAAVAARAPNSVPLFAASDEEGRAIVRVTDVGQL